jgi:hypothetical protein
VNNKFDFITDEELRRSLEEDCRELEVAFEHSAWKSAHVLVGSIVEALLVDSLISSGYLSSGSDDVLKLDLGKLVELCGARGILTDKTKELSTIVKSYRNLIHPGRLVRLKEQVDRSSATVANALLTMIIAEVSQRKKDQYGYTAEQIISKVEKDRSSITILPHLLRETKTHETERLLLKLLPDRYFEIKTEVKDDEIFDGEKHSTLNRLAKCFRIAFDAATDLTRIRVVEKFVTIVKEAEHETVLTYEDEFFRASDLRHAPQSDVAMVKEHLFSRLAEGRTIPLMNALEGIEEFLTEDEVLTIVDPLAKEISYGKVGLVKRSCQSFLTSLWIKTVSPLDAKILSRLQEWKALLETKDLPESLKAMESIIDECSLPF